MPRPLKTDRPVEKNLSLPASIVARIDLELYSPLEGRVPFGAWRDLVTRLLQEHISNLDKAARIDAMR